MKETKSNWAAVADMVKNQKEIAFGSHISQWFYEAPDQIIYLLSCYKFAAKMIGKNNRVLDLGCQEGVGTYLLSRECGFAKGIDVYQEAIASAKKNFEDEGLRFEVEGTAVPLKDEFYDAIVSLDVRRGIGTKNISQFWASLKSRLTLKGTVIIGAASHQQNDLSVVVEDSFFCQNLERKMKENFCFNFSFSVIEGIIFAGILPLAQHYLFVGCKKK